MTKETHVLLENVYILIHLDMTDEHEMKWWGSSISNLLLTFRFKITQTVNNLLSFKQK